MGARVTSAMADQDSSHSVLLRVEVQQLEGKPGEYDALEMWMTHSQAIEVGQALQRAGSELSGRKDN